MVRAVSLFDADQREKFIEVRGERIDRAYAAQN
jgi:hypothetical protein